MKHTWYIYVLLLASLLGCSYEPPQQPPLMVLEAWIDAGGFPTVLIHKSYILANAPDSVQSLEEVVENQLIPFGKVVVSDGEKEVVLTGRLDTTYLPPYTYTSIDMEGVPGKTYTVTATYKDMKATATTTIPPVAQLDSIAITTMMDSIKMIHAYMSLEEKEESYYALFMRKRGNKQYFLCPYGVFTSRDANNGCLDMTVYNPTVSDSTISSLNTYFHVGDPSTYQLKVARIDYTSYQFWKAYNEYILTQGIYFVSVYKNLPNNIEGGIGNFSGLGSTTYRFTLLNDTTLRY